MKISDEKILYYQNRAYSYRDKLTRNREDGDDFASFAIEELLRRIKKDKCPENFNFEHCLKEATRIHFGRRGSGKEANRIGRQREIKIDPSAFDVGCVGTISEQQLGSDETDRGLEENSRVDLELIARVNSGLIQDERDNVQIAKGYGVTESRIRQLKKKDREQFISRYLWEHYKEYGIETEIEVDWITL